MSIVSISFICIYIVAIFLMSAYFVRRALTSYMEYCFCGRSLTITFIIFTYLGTWIGGGTIVGLAGKAYSSGASQYWIFSISCLAGFLFVFLFLTRIRRLQVTSIADMLSMRFPDYKQAIRIPVTIGLIVRNVTVIGMNFAALSYMFTFSTGINQNLATLIVLTIVVIYTVLSGLWGVVVTDVLQGFMQTLGMLLLFYFTIRRCGGLGQILSFFHGAGLESRLSLTPGGADPAYVVFFVLAFGTYFLMSDQTDWERIYSCKTDKTAFWGYLIPLSITLLLLLIPAYIGVFQEFFTPTVPFNYILYWFSFQMLPQELTVFIMLTILSAVLSSTDSFMVASGVIISGDIIKRFINPNANDKELIFWSRIAVVISAAIGFAFAINLLDILDLWMVGIGVASVLLLPAYLMAWFSRRANTTGVLCGMIFGILYSAVLILNRVSCTPQRILTGILINASVSYFVSLFTKAPEKEQTETTFYWSERFRGLKNIPRQKNG